MSRIRLTSLLIFLVFLSRTNAREPVDLTNQGLVDVKIKAKEFLNNIKPSGDTLVLELDYFQKALTTPISVSKIDPATGQPGAAVSKKLADMDYKVFQCWLVAEQMLLSAEASGELVSDWNRRKTDVLATVGKDGSPPPRVFSPLSAEDTYWKAFLDKWEKDVINKDATRFQDALRQAAYSILRIGLEIEDKQIESVLQGNSPTGGATSRSTAGTSAQGSYHHSDVIHERLMNGIYRRHGRNMNKIVRITARR